MKREVPILLIEDDAIDLKHIRRAFADNRVTNPVFAVGNGEEALSFLRHEPPFADPERYPRPGLILLDLNMPRMDGLTFLAEYKADARIRRIPAVVMTTSDESVDRKRSYDLGVAGFIVKPLDFHEFAEAIRRFDLYWTLCEVPIDE
ncbi:MAG: response regulator [Gemmatimonadales bacterium]